MSKKYVITPWYIVYEEIALYLHRFYKRNKTNAGNLLFELLTSSTLYSKNNSWLSNIKRIETPSIEPIQVFVSFSRSGQRESSRKETINEVAKLLGKKGKNWSDINFEGCPTPMGLKLQYIRPEYAQKEIWEAFDRVMRMGTKALTQSLWDKVIRWRGIQIPSFTIFLFWIKSDKFLPLDKNTRQYLESGGLLVPGAPLYFATYKKLVSNKKLRNYTRLSEEAYYFNHDRETFNTKYGNSSLIRSKDLIETSFRFVGVRTLSRNANLHKVLKPKKYYPLDISIIPLENNNHNKETETASERFQLNLGGVENLYNQTNLKVNITAIVGKNGSGKSTLLDLVMMGIYNLSTELGYLDKKEYKPLKNLNFELYWTADTLYKISFGKDVVFYRFSLNKQDGQVTYSLERKPLKLDKLRTIFFYSILVNYSHYALNSSDYKIDWIKPLSHKNDGYITPIVINPKRTQGNININNEKDLLNMRLLLNLLELHDNDISQQSFRYIDNGKYIKYFSVSYDTAKQKEKIEEVKARVYEDSKIIPLVFNKIADVFAISQYKSEEIPYIEAIKHYLVNKMLTIVDRYDKYTLKYKSGLDFFIRENAATTIEMSSLDLQLSLASIIDDLLKEIKADSSHITLKFKQVLNYLKYSRLRNVLNTAIKTKSPIELDKYQKFINDIINKGTDNNLTVAELLPPAIFKLEFYIDDAEKSSFNKASSGEYQLVSVLSSILYHIRNIDSITGKNRYNYVIVLLDEIELYFHPNMQRFFVRKLLEALSKLDNELYGINILFSTHSPFILSDLQQQKILKLKNGEVVKSENAYNTFAANIHDLLADEFFLNEGYMGAYAQRQIEIVINILNYAKSILDLSILVSEGINFTKEELILMRKKIEYESSLYKRKLQELNYWNEYRRPENWDFNDEKEQILEIIEMIGEPLVKDKLLSMYREVSPENNEEKRSSSKETILRLMKENNFTHNDLI